MAMKSLISSMLQEEHADAENLRPAFKRAVPLEGVPFISDAKDKDVRSMQCT